MSNWNRRADAPPVGRKAQVTVQLSKRQYRTTLRRLQVELTKLQKHYIGCADWSLAR
jgi:hypothetical protein